jgi:predicted nucleotidyltransferase component of viral defense system
MTRKQPHNIAASVRQRLLNLSQTRQEEFQNVLTRYAIERFLYRLYQSEYQDKFILKGAMLFTIWSNEPHRATRDLDLLCMGDNSIDYLEHVFRDICSVQVEADGLDFRAETIQGDRIREDQEYEGVRIKLNAFLTGTATRMDIQVDIGFGDAVTPQAKIGEFPTILEGFPVPSLKSYPPETVISEKFQAMVALGIANSRMKDFYDIWYLCQHFRFEGKIVSQAIKATFDRRRTRVPVTLPLALTADFSEDAIKKKQWKAFIHRGKLKISQESLEAVIAVLQFFLIPPTEAITQEIEFDLIWNPGGPWEADMS